MSGWFDNVCFTDWFQTIIVPYCRRTSGVKVLLGDNLSSHFTSDVLNLCPEIKFKCLPANSTHLMQPLDVAFYAPLKKYCRMILLEWKKKDGRYIPALRKDYFPKLLSKLHEKLEMNATG